MSRCQETGCDSPVKALLLCSMHYQRLVKHGDAQARHGNIVHGLTGTPEHQAWLGMRHRCYSKNGRGYRYYGARGIEICDRWRNDPSAFAKDMGPRPPGTSIDRIDNNKGYEPGNCRWATDEQQARNTSRNHNITYRETTMCVTAWALKIGMKRNCLVARISKGWSIERAIETPTAPRRRRGGC